MKYLKQLVQVSSALHYLQAGCLYSDPDPLLCSMIGNSVGSK